MKGDLDFTDRVDVGIGIHQGLPSTGHFHIQIGPFVPEAQDDELMLSLNEGQARVLRARLEAAIRSFEYGMRQRQEGRR